MRSVQHSTRTDSYSPGGPTSRIAPATFSRLFSIGHIRRHRVGTPASSLPPAVLSLVVVLAFTVIPGLTASADETNSSEPRVVEAVYVADDKQEKTVRGELVIEKPGFGHLILSRDGVLTAITPSELKSIREVDEKLVPITAKELGEQLLLQMPGNAKILTSDHFVICYNTTDVYARWNINLYERLYKGFYRFWKSKGIELTPPRFPLVAMVFETKADYVRYASQDFQGSENTFGYYHQATNRLASYDLTGIEGYLPPGAQVNRETLINQILSRPEAERTVATIVHEACHQIAFNSGLQVRLGNNPLWLSEGLATYFEAPDLSSQTGWGGIGKVNMHNYRNLIKYLPNRPADSLEMMLTQDNRFRDGDTMLSSYAEAWGVTHFLIQTKPKELLKYLESLRSTPVGTQHTAKERLDLFRSHFGDDLSKIERDLMRHIQRLK